MTPRPDQSSFDALTAISQPNYRSGAAERARLSLVAKFRLRLAGLLTGDLADPGPQPVQDTTATGAVDATYASFADWMWNIRYERRAVYWDLLDMDRNGAIVSTMLDIIASGTVYSEDHSVDGFAWELASPQPGAQELLDSMQVRLQLGPEAWQIVRRFVCFGNEFCEIVLDQDGIVQGFNSLPEYTIEPRFDILGNRLPGWTQKPEQLSLRIQQFDEWQIVPFISGPRTGFYGRGLMVPARRSWRRHEKLTDGMAIARLTRAYDRTVFKVPVKPDWPMTKQWEILNLFKQSLTKRRTLDQGGNLNARDDPLTPSTEIFIPDDGTKRGGVETLTQQNMQLMVVDDLRYLQEEFLCRGRVPKRWLNLAIKGQTESAGSIAAGDKQFAWLLLQNQGIFKGGMTTLGNRALLARGFNPAKLGLSVRMAKVNVSDQLEQAKVDFTEAQAAQLFSMTLLQGGMPTEIVVDRYMKLSPDEKAVMTAFQGDLEKQRALAAASASAAAAGGRTSLPATGGAPKEGMQALQVAEVLAKWGMFAQEEAERQGMHFGIGHEERLRRAMEAIWEVGYQDAA